MACPIEEDVAQYVVGTLGDEERDSVTKHLDRCVACRQHVSVITRGLPDTYSSTHKHQEETVPGVFVGGQVGRYILLSELAAGQQGLVYIAYDPDLDRTIALKLLHPKQSSADPQSVLLSEARLMARLSHPNIVTIHDVGSVDGRVFVALEYVVGKTLREWLMATERKWPEIFQLLLEVGSGLSAAHAAGVIHRDIKPDNILIGLDGRARITDFGLGHAGLAPNIGPAASSEPILDVSYSKTGDLVGTPAYMAPEQFEGGGASVFSDQYAFCVLAFECICGMRPHPAQSLSALKRSVLDAEPKRFCPKFSEARRLDDAITKGLQRQPQARHASIGSLLAAFRRADKANRRRKYLLLAATVLLGVLALLVYLKSTAVDDSCEAIVAKIDSGWGDAQRNDIKSRFTSLGSPRSASFARVESGLSNYSKQLYDADIRVCRANRRDQVAALVVPRRLCIEVRRGYLRETVTVYSQAISVQAADEAPNIIARLPRVADCFDDSRVLDGLPLPAQEVRRTEIVAAQRKIARARLFRDTSKMREGVVVAVQAVAAAESIGYPGVIAAAKMELAEFRIVEGEFAAAERLVRDAIQRAAQARDDSLVAKTWTTLAWIGYHGNRLAQVDEWLAASLAATKQAGESYELVSLHGHVAGAVAMLRHDYRGAQAHFALALSSARTAYGELDPRTISLAVSLADTVFELGDYERAVAAYRFALASQRKLLGDRHTGVAHILESLGMVLSRTGHVDEAGVVLQQMLDIYREVLGAKHIRYARGLVDLGRLATIKEDYVAATTYVREAIDSQQHAASRDQIFLAGAYQVLGYAQRQQGQLGAAETSLVRALELREEVVGKAHASLSTTLTHLGSLWRVMERYDDAMAVYERARVLAQNQGPVSASLAFVLSELGNVWREKSRPAEARRLFGRALDIFEKRYGQQASQVATLEADIAGTFIDERRWRRAIRHLRRAVDIAASDKTWTQSQLANIRSELGISLVESSRYLEAIPHLEFGLRVFESQGEAALAATRFALARALARAGRYPDKVRALTELAWRGRAGLPPDMKKRLAAWRNRR